MHHGREWHLCLARHSALLYRRHEHKSIRDLMERRAAALYLADHWQHIGGVLIGDCLERRYSGLAGVIALWATKWPRREPWQPQGPLWSAATTKDTLCASVICSAMLAMLLASLALPMAYARLLQPGRQRNGATVPELEAIFGWHGGGMATHYTKEANRVHLAREAIHKLANETRTSNPSPCDEVRALGPKG